MILNHEEIYDYLVEPHELNFDPKVFGSLIDQRVSECVDGVVPVISSEILVGSPFIGARESVDIARRIATCVPEAHIVMVLRNQVESLCSLYKQFVRSGGVGTVNEFFDPPKAYSYRWFSIDYFKYDRLVEFYLKLFGVERVSVMLYEDFAERPRAFASQLCKSIGISSSGIDELDFSRIYPSLSYLSTRILRPINRFEASPNSPFPFINISGLRVTTQRVLHRADKICFNRSSDMKLRSFVNQRFGSSFSDSNARLSLLLGRSMSDLGYI